MCRSTAFCRANAVKGRSPLREHISEKLKTVRHDFPHLVLDGAWQAPGVKQQSPRKQCRLRHVLLLWPVTCILGHEVGVCALCLLPCGARQHWVVQSCMHGLMEHGFFKVMVPQPCCLVLGLQHKEAALVLSAGSKASLVYNHMIQLRSHDRREFPYRTRRLTGEFARGIP